MGMGSGNPCGANYEIHMKKTLFGTIAALAFALPISAAETDRDYWEGSGWYVSANTMPDGIPYCRLIAGWENGMSLAINFFPASNDASIGFVLPMSKAANFSPERNYEISVILIKNKQIVDGWGERDFRVANSSDRSSRVFLSSELEAEVFMNDVAESTTVAFNMHNNTRYLANFDIRDIAVGIDKLRECGYSRMID